MAQPLRVFQKGFAIWATCLLAVCFAPIASSQSIQLDYSNRPGAALAQRKLNLIQSGNTTYSSITLKGYGSLLNQTQLDDALRILSDELSDLHYELNVPVSKATLQTLQDFHPDCRLHYTIPFSYWDSYDDRIPAVQGGGEPFHEIRTRQRREILGQCSNLYAIEARLDYGPEDNFDELPFIYDVLTNCPNVRELDLSLSHSGCIVGSYEKAFDFTSGNRPMPPLEKLTLSQYAFNYLPSGEPRYGWRDNAKAKPEFGMRSLPALWRAYIKTAYHYGFQQVYNAIVGNGGSYSDHSSLAPGHSRPDNLDIWLARMDWSKMRKLDLGSFDATQRAIAGGASPESLHLRGGCDCDTQQHSNLIRNLTKPIKHLYLQDVRFDAYDSVIGALSETRDALQTLTLAEGEYNRHEYCSSQPLEAECPEYFGSYWSPRPFLSPQQLRQISLQNPNISSLEIDIARAVPDIEDRSTWSLDYATVEAAALAPSVSQLRLNIESPDMYLVRNHRLSEYGYSSRGVFNELPVFTFDPSLNRSSVLALFESMNRDRSDESLAPLEQLEVKVGRWSSRYTDWEMMGPPKLMIGRWVCKYDHDDGQSGCYGGNDSLDHYDRPFEEPYSEDWTKPNPKRNHHWWDEVDEHDEL